MKTAGFVYAATAWAALAIVPGIAQEDAQKAGSDHGTSRSDGGGIGATNSGTDKGNNPGQFASVAAWYADATMKRNGYPIIPMTLGNMRENGVRSLAVSCSLCHHRAVVDAAAWPDDVPVPTFGPRMVCTRCGNVGADARPNWREQPKRVSLTGAQ